MTFKRVKVIRYLFIFIFIMFLVVDSWLFYSMSQSSNPDSLLVAMAIVVAVIDIIFLILTILNFLKRTNAIEVKDGKLIIYNYKKIVVNFNDVKDIKYIPYMGPSGKYNIFGIGWRTTGQIVIYLHNNKKIYVSDIKKVSTACVDLRKIVLDIAD
ncbi:unknown [Clostridium sp. CAG:288]|nr:unknown [Clostridium sp. CAG:288]